MKKITYAQMKTEMRKAYAEGREAQKAVVVITEDSFTQYYSLESRSYEITADNKMFRNCGGYSLFGSALDGTDNGTRLDWYIDVEYGKDCCGNNAWHVDYCYMVD